MPKRNYDPTNTTGPRKAFASKVNAQFDSVRRDAGILIRSMNPDAPPDVLRDRVRSFRAWLGDTLDRKVLPDTAKGQWEDYLERMYQKGANSAYSLQEKGLPARTEFLKLMGKNRGAVESLQDQAWEEMTNVATDARVKAGRALAEGLARGDPPRTIAAEVDRQLVKSAKRAETAAHHEAVRAHAEGQLTAFEMMGTERVTAAVEWNTAGDGKVCNLCAPLANLVLTPREARGLIPRHVNCRCSWQAAVNRSTNPQIKRAFASSLKNGPKGSKWKPPRLAKKR